VVDKIVLVIDRDDDLGRKAGISSPVIGRDKNLKSAIKLAEADPEDSDLNTIFSAIKIYDELRKKGENVEIVTICGDERVGMISDEKISKQLDLIKNELKAEKVVVVTDGSEDEYVIPLISSRFDIDGVIRVVVKQSKTIESTYYLIKKMFEDPKIAKSTLAPIGIILLVYSISLLLQTPELGVGAIALILGLYFIIKAYGFEESVESYFSTIKRSLMEGRLSFITYVIALLLFIIGIVQGSYYVWIKAQSSLVVLITSFIYGSIWWIVSSGVFIAIGKIFDHIIEKKDFRKYISMMLLIISTGFVLWGSSRFIISMSEETSPEIQSLIASILASIFIAVLGVVPLKIRYEG